MPAQATDGEANAQLDAPCAAIAAWPRRAMGLPILIPRSPRPWLALRDGQGEMAVGTVVTVMSAPIVFGWLAKRRLFGADMAFQLPSRWTEPFAERAGCCCRVSPCWVERVVAPNFIMTALLATRRNGNKSTAVLKTHEVYGQGRVQRVGRVLSCHVP